MLRMRDNSTAPITCPETAAQADQVSRILSTCVFLHLQPEIDIFYETPTQVRLDHCTIRGNCRVSSVESSVFDNDADSGFLVGSCARRITSDVGYCAGDE